MFKNLTRFQQVKKDYRITLKITKIGALVEDDC
jgi:hypothetical protein